MPIYTLGDLKPQISPSAWVADSAQLIGDVMLHDHSSIWFGAILRADNARIEIGDHSNIQDSAVLHADPGFPTTLGSHVSVGHQVMLHGCTIGDGSLIGIGSIILNGAQIGKNCLVGAGSLITEGKHFPDGSLIMGRPAKIVRELTPAQISGLRDTALRYVDNAQRHHAGLSAASASRIKDGNTPT